MVAAGGTNFSKGQKQMISVARALLKRGSIVVLDEGMHSTDPFTAEKIRQTIREEFAGSLLLNGEFLAFCPRSEITYHSHSDSSTRYDY